MSGQSQEILSGLARPAVRDPGQNGSSVWSEADKPPDRSCSWAVTGYTPKLLIPSVLTWNEAVQEALAPGPRLTGSTSGFPAGCSPVATPRDTKSFIPMRVVKWVAEVFSCTSRPACVCRVPLVTVPDTVTVAPGLAYCGFIVSMVTERPPVAARPAGLACAGTAWASPAATIAAGTAIMAARERVR